MQETKTTTESKANEQDEEFRLPWTSDVIGTVDKELVYIDKLKKVDPKEAEKRLSDLSKAYLKFLNSSRLRANLMIGLSQFEKRAKRRATRKPLTVRKLQSLQDDLRTLVEMFKIKD